MERGRANLIKYADICYIPLICFVKHKLCYGNIASPVDAIICTSVSPAAALFAPRPSFGSPAIESIEGLLGDVLPHKIYKIAQCLHSIKVFVCIAHKT
nr:hypothetical protein Iba_chr10fCG9870 [Ipomoea batatas]